MKAILKVMLLSGLLGFTINNDVNAYGNNFIFSHNHAIGDTLINKRSKWSTSLVFNLNYLLPDFYTNQNSREPMPIIKYGGQFLFSYQKNRYLFFEFGFAVNSYKTNANTPTAVFKPKFESDYSFYSFPLSYSPILYENHRVVLQPTLGFNVSFLYLNETIAHWDNGDILVNNWFTNGKSSLFCSVGFRTLIKITSKISFSIALLGSRQITPMKYYYSGTSGNQIIDKQWLAILQNQIGINYRW